MDSPFFYIPEYNFSEKLIGLGEETSRHIVQVLRMKEGEQLNLTDGKGNLLTCEISEAAKKSCIVEVKEIKNVKPKTKNISIGISLLKNTNRFEWFLEKATEIGISEIIPLICERTEKEKFRHDRLNTICTSAMLQSQQCWLPRLHEPQSFSHPAIQQSNHQNKFIAHCQAESKQQLSNQIIQQSSLILIGPEGDFTKQEVDLALENHFLPVTLGSTRLRSETAGVVAAAILKTP